jgi:uncharacterized protein DUF6884
VVIVIQCASNKQERAGHLRTRDGRRVVFVARPELATQGGDVWARPDDASDVTRLTWRARLEASQADQSHLLPAIELYTNSAYGELGRRFGSERVFILSAGWGLVRGSYRLPKYDITFSKQADKYKQRRPEDSYQDFNQLPREPDGPVVFLGGRDYLPLFSALTRDVRAKVVVPYRCPPGPGTGTVRREGHLLLVPYPTAALTNWYYGCAKRLCDDPSFLEKAAL